jgi:hypothetical protein
MKIKFHLVIKDLKTFKKHNENLDISSRASWRWCLYRRLSYDESGK